MRNSFYIMLFLMLSGSLLFAENDSTASKISFSMGGNLTKTTARTKSLLEFNRGEPRPKRISYGFFIEGAFSKKCFKRYVFETKMILELRHVLDEGVIPANFQDNQFIVYVYANQLNYCLAISPLLYRTLNKHISIGIGPSLNYLLVTKYAFHTPFEGGNVNAYIYKRFQPEINAAFKITLKRVALSLGYSMSVMDKVKGSDNSIKEHDRVLRLGVGYIFNINNKKKND